MPTTPEASAGIFTLIASSGLIVKLVLLMLAGASVFCWAIIFTKWRSLNRAIQQNTQFLTLFWHSKSIEELAEKSVRYPSSPVAAVFQAGLRELAKFAPTGTPTSKTFFALWYALPIPKSRLSNDM